MSVARCPVCGKQSPATESPHPPFCSLRCRQIDLNRWLTEGYALPLPNDDDSAETLHEDEAND